METTEHHFPIDVTKGVSTGLEQNGVYTHLKLVGELIDGTLIYENSGAFESSIIEIGDLFKEFSPIAARQIESGDVGLHQPASTSVTFTKYGTHYYFTGVMNANASTRILTKPFDTNNDRYFELEMTNTNRYINICIMPEGAADPVAYPLYYMLNEGLHANQLMGFHVRWAEQLLDVYVNGVLHKSKPMVLDLTKNYHVALRSYSSRTHAGNFYFYSNQFNYAPPKGAISIDEVSMLKNMEFFTSTSMDGVEWGEFKPLANGRIQSEIGKYLRVRLKVTARTKLHTYKEYDFESRDENPRIATAHNVTDDIFMHATTDAQVSAAANEDQSVFRIKVKRSELKRIDTVSLTRAEPNRS